MKNKNIWLVPTLQESRLHFTKKGICYLSVDRFVQDDKENYQSVNLYITSDEEIKEGDWFITKEEVFKCTLSDEFIWRNNFDKFPSIKIDCKKIILTTDQELIKEGIQPIPDEFLKWFVKNPSCESVVVKYQYWKEINDVGKYTYKIIIPSEEPKPHILSCCISLEECYCGKYPKQETLDELAKTNANYESGKNTNPSKEHFKLALKRAYIKGYEESEKHLYSEEEVLKLLEDYDREFKLDTFAYTNPCSFTVKEWFNQYKK